MAEVAQGIAVVIIVGLAAFAMVRRLRAAARGEAQCGKCPDCEATPRPADSGAVGGEP